MNTNSLLHSMLLSHNVNEKHPSQAKHINNEKTEQDRTHKKVAEEMESLFAYQLIKTMRQTANSLSAEKKSSGHDTYMSMFDMEISKLFAKRGMGLQESILNWLARMPGSIYNSTNTKK